MKTHLRWTSLLLTIGLLASACTAPAGTGGQGGEKPVYQLPAQLEGIQVRAEDSDASGIGINSAFEITVPGGADLALLENHLALSPETPFSLLGGRDDNTVRLLPQQSLTPDLVYRVEALTDSGQRARTWAFQTRAPLTVVGTTPENGSYYVSRTTGIEFVFNQENVDISSHFSIEPPVEGEFLTYGKRSAFAPTLPLQNNTQYTVTLSQGLMSPDGTALLKDFTLSFEVNEQESEQVYPVSVYMEDAWAENFLSTDLPVVNISAHDMKGAQTVEARVYSLSSGDYRGELAKRYDQESFRSGEDLFSTGGLTPQLTFTKQLTPDTYQNSYYDWETDSYVDQGMALRTYAYGYLAFPGTLDEGYYLLELRAQDPVTGDVDIRQRPLMVNDTVVYLNTINGQAIAWLNDAASGESLAGVEIRLMDGTGSRRLSSATTGADGTALWENGADEDIALLQVVRGEDGPDYLDLLYTAPKQEPTAQQLYVSFAFTDRGSYMSTDTAHIWGTVRGRREPLSQDLPLRLEMIRGYDHYYYEEQAEEEPLLSQEVSLQADGSFSAEFTFEDLVSGYYSIRLLDEADRVVQNQSILIADYVKPVYVASCWSDKAFYLPGETVDINLQVAYYDGTPTYGVPYTLQLPQNYFYGEPAPVYYTPREGGAYDGYDIDEPVSNDSYSQEDGRSRAYTNELGVIRAEAAPFFTGNWFPASFDYYFESTGEYLYDFQHGSAIYFPSDVIFTTERKYTAGGQAEIHVGTNRLDTSGITTYDDIYGENYPENITGEGVDATVSVTVYKNTYHSEREMAAIATSYDWASKKTQYQMDYNYNCWTEKEVLASYDAVATGGKLVITGLPQQGEAGNITYCATVSVGDSLGNVQEDTIYLYPQFYPYFEEYGAAGEESETRLSSRVSYSFADAPRFLEEGYIQPYQSLKPGESADILLVESRPQYSSDYYYGYRSHDTVPEKGKFLYFLAGDDIQWHKISGEPRFSVEMKEAYMPSSAVLGAYFDGSHIYPVERTMDLRYNYEDQELTIALEADKERYGPGGEVNLTAAVTDAEGKGVQSRLNLSVVDEAIFAISDPGTDPLHALYTDYRYQSGSGGYISYRQHSDYYDYIKYQLESGGDGYAEDIAMSESRDGDPNPSTGGGGGDSGYTRTKFMDTAQFLMLETDESGNAQVRFTLPDNLTSWRVTGAAVAGNSLRAGTGIINLTATVDMFVNVLYNDTYLTGDDVGASLTAQGRVLQGSTPIRYTVEVVNAATGKTVVRQERKGRSDCPVHLSFGQLPMGNYTLTVQGATNEGSDKLSYPFAVVTSNLELPVVRSILLDGSGDPLDINPARYPILVGFSDQRYGNYLTAASYLAGRNSDRFDTMVAAVGARRFLEQYLPEEYADYYEDIPKSYAGLSLGDYFSGLYSLYGYDSGGLELTARALALSGVEMPYSHYVGERLRDYARFADPEEETEVLAMRAKVDGDTLVTKINVEPGGAEEVNPSAASVDVANPGANSGDAVSPVTDSVDAINPVTDSVDAVNPVTDSVDAVNPVTDSVDAVNPVTDSVGEENPGTDGVEVSIPSGEYGINPNTDSMDDKPLVELAENTSIGMADEAVDQEPYNPSFEQMDEDYVGEPYNGYPGDYTVSAGATSPDEKAAALMGLAALNQPVLLDLQKRLQEPELFTLSGQMYLVSGLALLGDFETAQQFYNETISPQLQTMGDYKRMPAEGDDEGYAHTAQALMTASLLGHEDAHGLAAYLLDNRSPYYSPVIELALYLKTFQPVGDEAASFQYTRDGKTQKAALEPGEIHYVRFMKEDLENGGIKATSGNVTATVSYTGGADDFSYAYPEEENPAPEVMPLQIEREIRATTMEDIKRFESCDITREEDLEGLYTVTMRIYFDEAAPTGGYTIHDRAPSSLRAGFETVVLHNGEQENGGDTYRNSPYYYYCHYNFDKQNRTMTLYRYYESTFDQMTPPEETVEIIYIGQRLYAGNSQMEPVLVQHSDSNMSVLLTPSVEGSLAPGAEAKKRAYPSKYISGGTPRTEVDSNV